MATSYDDLSFMSRVGDSGMCERQHIVCMAGDVPCVSYVTDLVDIRAISDLFLERWYDVPPTEWIRRA